MFTQTFTALVIEIKVWVVALDIKMFVSVKKKKMVLGRSSLRHLFTDTFATTSVRIRPTALLNPD